MRHAPIRVPVTARGSVLIISMLMLLVLTILGVTALSMVTLEERMARSFEHGELAFQGSESAIMHGLDLGSPQMLDANGNPVTRPTYVANDDPLTKAAVVCNGTQNFPYDADPKHTLTNTTLLSTGTVTYLGERTNPPGEQLGTNLVAHQFNINAVTVVGSTAVRANHSRGVYLVRAGSGGCNYVSAPALP